MDVLGKLRSELNKREWSVYRLAQVSGINPSTLGNMFARNNTPTIPTLERICGALGITLAEFFSEDSTPAPEETLNTQMEKSWKNLSPAQKKLILEIISQIK